MNIIAVIVAWFRSLWVEAPSVTHEANLSRYNSRECVRRRRQIASGFLTHANGLVK